MTRGSGFVFMATFSNIRPRNTERSSANKIAPQHSFTNNVSNQKLALKNNMTHQALRSAPLMPEIMALSG